MQRETGPQETQVFITGATDDEADWLHNLPEAKKERAVIWPEGFAEFDPDQARDESGRWTSGGGGGGIGISAEVIGTAVKGIQDLPHERLCSWMADGSRLPDMDGSESRVYVSATHAQMLKGGICVHNHPGRGTPCFSMTDIAMAEQCKLAETRIVTPGPPVRGWMSLRPRKEWPDVMKVQSTFDRIKQEESQKYFEMEWGSEGMKERGKKLSRIIWRRVAAENGLIYEDGES